MPVQWDLALPRHDFGQIALAGFEQGKQMRRERETDNALAAYAQNRGDPNAVNALLRVNPRVGMQVQDQELQAQRQKQEFALKSQASWRAMQKEEQADFVEAAKFMTNGQMMIEQLNEADRPAAWKRLVDVAQKERGWDIPDGMEAYSPDAVRALASLAGMAGEMLDLNKVQWQSIGEGGAIPISATTGLRVDRPGAESVGVEGVSSEDAGAILQGAAQAGKISKVDAIRMTRSLGKNGDAKFQQWMRQNGVTVVDDAPPPPPPGFVLD